MLQIKFAYVRFKDDRSCKNVLVDAIYQKEVVHGEIEFFKIKPAHKADFSRTSWYYVKIRHCSNDCNDKHDHFIFLKTSILNFGSSEEDIEQQITNKRIRYAVINASSSETDHQINKNQQKHQPTVKRKMISDIRKEVKKKQNEEILSQIKKNFHPLPFIDSDSEQNDVESHTSKYSRCKHAPSNNSLNPRIILEKQVYHLPAAQEKRCPLQNVTCHQQQDNNEEVEEHNIFSLFENELDKRNAMKGGVNNSSYKNSNAQKNNTTQLNVGEKLKDINPDINTNDIQPSSPESLL